MIKHMFVFGVIIPTLITILLFVSFLICWFKFNIRERLFANKKFFSKQLKQAMAAHQGTGSTGSGSAGSNTCSKKGHFSSDPTSRGSKSGVSRENMANDRSPTGGISCLNVPKSKKHYENCEDREHSVGEDPEAALCAACEDEQQRRISFTGYTNPNLCVSPSHSNDGGDEQTETEDHSDNDTECVHVKKVGSMIQHTFHFPASEGPHLSNSLVVDSEDGGSEDGNYSNFVPISNLILDSKAKQFYEAARNGAESPIGDLSGGLQNGNRVTSTVA